MHMGTLPALIIVWAAISCGIAEVYGKHPPPSPCECGYSVNSTNGTDPYALFTDLLETDFLHLYSLPSSIDVPASKEVGWAPQTYNVSAADARGSYGKSAELDNVVVNPLPGSDVWGGQGKLGGAPGLQIWVRSQNDLLSLDGEDMVRIGEINSLRRDMRYGSFRVGMCMSDIAGTCAAFFWYRNNSQEIDMEYLTRQTNTSNSSYPINLVIQTPASVQAGFNAAGTSTFLLIPLPFTPGDGYHEYRFDWTSERIVFYADGTRMADFENALDGDAPDAPGTMMLNHWSNGDPGWSGGPPQQDAVLTISYMKAYFNSSNETRATEWSAACAHGNWQNRTCQIPDFPNTGIDPLGNMTEDPGKSYFFMYNDGVGANQSSYPAATKGTGSSSSGSSIVKTSEIWQLLGLTVISHFIGLGL